MSKAIAAALIGVLVTWLLRRERPVGDLDVPESGLWSAFDRGEDPTAE